jgi:glycerol-3-phosphate dehydrogenase (NAD(P)+)
MQSQEAIAVIGAGSWGTALATVLARNGQTVHLWDKDEASLKDMNENRRNSRYIPEAILSDKIKVCFDLETALKGVEDVLFVVPSHVFDVALQDCLPFLTPTARIAWATKGLDPKGELLHIVAEKILGKRSFAILSGPSFAKEVALGMPTAVNLASNDTRFAKDLAARFHQPFFNIYPTDDLIGVSLGGVVKNVLAVAVGISDGIEFGANARAALIIRGLAEMMVLGEAMGAKKETLMGLAGCGDVILTCTDNQSRNRRFGLALASGLSADKALQSIGQVVEAVYNVDQLCRLAEIYHVELPIVKQMFRVIREGVSPKEALGSFFHPATKFD